MVAIMRAHGERPSLVWKGPRRAVREAALGFATAPLLFFGSAIFLNALRLFVPSLHNVPNNPLERLANNAQQSAIFAFVAILAGGVREELQRGFMLYRFEKYLGGGGVGLVVTSVLFGMLHGIQGWDAMIVTGCSRRVLGVDVPGAAQHDWPDEQPRALRYSSDSPPGCRRGTLVITREESCRKRSGFTSRVDLKS